MISFQNRNFKYQLSSYTSQTNQVTNFFTQWYYVLRVVNISMLSIGSVIRLTLRRRRFMRTYQLVRFCMNCTNLGTTVYSRYAAISWCTNASRLCVNDRIHLSITLDELAISSLNVNGTPSSCKGNCVMHSNNSVCIKFYSAEKISLGTEPVT